MGFILSSMTFAQGQNRSRCVLSRNLYTPGLPSKCRFTLLVYKVDDYIQPTRSADRAFERNDL